MKFFGGNLSKSGGARADKHPRILSVAQLVAIGISVTGVILLIASLAAYRINSTVVDRYYVERTRTLAGELAYGLIGLVQESIAKVEWVALDPEVVEALISKDPVRIADTEARLEKEFPELAIRFV